MDVRTGYGLTFGRDPRFSPPYESTEVRTPAR
jgi:hypothetical protein